MEELYFHPIRCTCGKVVAHITQKLEQAIKDKMDLDTFLTENGFPPRFYCCRRTLLANIRGYYLVEENEDDEDKYFDSTNIEKAYYPTENITQNPKQEEKMENIVEESRDTYKNINLDESLAEEEKTYTRKSKRQEEQIEKRLRRKRAGGRGRRKKFIIDE